MAAYSGPIQLDRLIDVQFLWRTGECPYTFLAFSASEINEYGVPADTQAQQYIAAIQEEGVPVGIWTDTPVKNTAYAAVGPADIASLHRAVKVLVDSRRYSPSFLAQLSERLIQNIREA